MKILQLTNKPPWPAKDGGSIAVFHLTSGLSQCGHEMTILAMNTLKHHISPEELPENIKNYGHFNWVDVPASTSLLKALTNLLFSKKPYNAVRFISKAYSNRLKDLLREKDYDIIQLEGLYLCPYIPLIREYSHAIIAYRAHNIEHEIWDRTSAVSSGLKKWYLHNLSVRIRMFEEQCLNQYDLLVPITERDGKILNEMGNVKPMYVSSTGIDMKNIPASEENVEFPSLFHIGALDWTPNQEGLLWFLKNCWGEISKRHPDLKFYIAGRNAPRWLTDKLSIKGVVFLGEIEDAYALMASKAIMVVPLLSGSGMRIKIIEGMALGKTIISTSIGAEGLPVTHLQNILLANLPEDFIHDINMLIKNRSLAEKIGLQGKQTIRDHFDNRLMAEKLACFYHKHLS
jgi:polysaccharide biosynthesis protein PslH